MFELAIVTDISSAHFLRQYKGKCKNLHGHTWKLEVTINSDQLDSIGMVSDFGMLKGKLNEFLAVLDHSNLNELPFFKDVNPTTENIAKYIYQNFSKEIQPLRVKKVQVWESETSSITYYE